MRSSLSDILYLTETSAFKAQQDLIIASHSGVVISGGDEATTSSAPIKQLTFTLAILLGRLSRVI
jgi:hypothetical protein